MARFVLEIFLSSTSEDLRAYRAAVADALGRLGQVTIRMESWGARPTAPLPTCRDQVQQCDALVVVVGHRYGWVPPKEGDADGLKSITWLEVEWALAAPKPVYAFLVDPAAPWPGPREQDMLLAAKTEADGLAVWRRVRSLQEFRDFLEYGVTRALFASADQLATLVATSLFPLVLEHEVAQARAAVKEAPVPTPPPAPRPAPKRVAPPAFHLSATKDQAVVVGSDIVLFARGIPAEQRSDVVNALLLAQLARKSVPSPRTLDEVERWYEEYVEVLSNIGFAFEGRHWERVTGDSHELDLHQIMVDVARVTLDPAALALVARTLASLQCLPANSPTVSLFVVKGFQRAAHFQVVLVEPGDADGLRLRTMAFGLQTAGAFSQILFFESAKNVNALLKGTDTVTVKMAVLGAVRDAITAKLATHVGANVAGLDVD